MGRFDFDLNGEDSERSLWGLERDQGCCKRVMDVDQRIWPIAGVFGLGKDSTGQSGGGEADGSIEEIRK